MTVTEKLLKGSIDTHMHTSPDPRSERRVDALQAAIYAQEAGMRAIVLKSHEYPTVPVAYTVSQVVEDILVFGSIALDYEVGGLNPYAVTASGKMGAKICWMPTMTSANDLRRKGITNMGAGIVLTDKKGKLLPVMEEILELVKKYDMALATGHVSPEEAFTLVAEAHSGGIKKIIITHPLFDKMGATLSVADQVRMADMGGTIEHCISNTMAMNQLSPKKIVEAVRAVGAERTILSTDMGQYNNPQPAEGMRVGIAIMLSCGLSEKEIELMVKVNPARLLGLD